MSDRLASTASPDREAVAVSPTLVSLCSGVGALDRAVEVVFDAETIALVEYDADPSRVLAARFPGVVNLRDVKDLAWAELRAWIVAAGYPCQPFSIAGKRLGLEDERHLYPWISLGIEKARPEFVALENVRNHLRIGWSVVVADLDRIGYDVRWLLLHASDVGAPHGRARLFALGRLRDAGGWPVPAGDPVATIDEAGDWWEPNDGLFGAVPYQADPPPYGVQVDGIVYATMPVGMPAPGLILLPSPTTGRNRASRGALTGTGPGCDTRPGGQWSGPGLEQAIELARGELPREYESWEEVRGRAGALLPTPAVNDMGARKTIEQWDTWTAEKKAQHGNGNGHGDSLHIEVLRLLPTPEAKLSDSGPDSLGGVTKALGEGTLFAIDETPDTLLPTPRATDGEKGGPNQSGSREGDVMLPAAVQPSRWSVYEPAIRRWEALTRPAPPPTQIGEKGGHQLSPAFVEWMMGWPAGWVTEPGLWVGLTPAAARNAMLKACGNGVVIAQAEAAFRLLAADVLPLT